MSAIDKLDASLNELTMIIRSVQTADLRHRLLLAAGSVICDIGSLRGELAAPILPESYDDPVQPEKTLRDEFAMRAMQAAATNHVGANVFTFEERAEWAYMQADAMLAARKPPP